jgi:hypothetical protein
MILKVLRAAITVWLFSFPITAKAGGVEEPADIPEAQAIIDACWAISEELRASINTDDIRYGSLKTALCLEAEIARNMDILVDDPRERIEEHLENLRTAHGGLYWSMFNHVEACDLGCGTIFYSFHNTFLAKLYEGILKDVIEQRMRYRQ